MIREKLIEKNVGHSKQFRWRSHEISRIEGLSDGVFAFAVTLLVVSLEVPRTFTELMETMRGFGAFAVSFLLLMVVWYNQYKFFRRYGLQDTYTVFLNAALLFVVLFYIYPLKFLFTWLLSGLTGGGRVAHLPDGTVERMVQGDAQMATLMIIFGVGYVAVFFVFILLYLHAYRQRAALDLNQLEVFDTRTDIQECALSVLVGLFSIALVSIGGPGYAGLSGMVYMLIGVIMTIHGTLMGRSRRKLEARFTARATEAA
jgi:hypothetical protein